MAADENALLAVRDVGPIVAASIAHFFANEKNRNAVGRLLACGFEFAPVATPVYASADSPIAGKTFSADRYAAHAQARRSESDDRSGRRQGLWLGVQKTHYVVAGAEAGSKLDDAQKLGIPVLQESEFLDLIKSST